MKVKEHYDVAIYLRLSRDDEDIDSRKTESNSISSQRDMIHAYIRKQEYMEIYDTYVDDGYSGANFDRPEFQRMMKDIKSGYVNCVIVKDLSRLGRDYIEAGRLIQKTFPAFSVRFIALTDHFDSLTADYNQMSLVIPVKNFVNDSYSRDISVKVRSHQNVKREKGDFIGAFAVYGYQKNPDNKNQLEPDKYAAEIVKRIFAWKIEGYSNHAIAQLLDSVGILSPMEYKKTQGNKFQTGFITGVTTRWSAVAIKRILTNETYIGTLVQGKEEKVNYKVKKSVKKPREQWIRVENTHKAIVSREDFGLVQNLLMLDMRASEGERKAHTYAGILFCGSCMKPMIRRVNYYRGKEHVSFICSTKNKRGDCIRHTISQNTLNELVLTILQQQVAVFIHESSVLRSLKQIEINSEVVDGFDREIQRLYHEQEKYQKLRTGMYGDLKKEIITEEEFKNFREIYEKRYRMLEQAIRCQREIIKKLACSKVTAEIYLEQMKKRLEITQIDRLTLLSFVNKILVYEDKRVYLELGYRNLFPIGIRRADQ